ncbi:MAG: SDR family oxidoreductase [Myxococcota bacterium]
MSTPSPVGPSGFGFDSTAEDVTAGLDLTGQTWLVTGCNSGLGLETARVLHARGAHIIGAARTADKAARAFAEVGIPADAATTVACELSDLASVRACVAAVSALDRRLDGIIANAGIMALPELRQQHGIELQFFTNHVGHFALVTGLLDRLTDSGRVVMLSSGAHRMAHRAGIEFDNLSGEREYQAWRMYGNSKLANILFARSLARRFAAEGSERTANALHPGVIKTALARNMENPEGMYDSLVKQRGIVLKSVGQGAATQCYVATSPALAGVSGKYFSDCNVEEPTPAALDDAMADRLWTVTEALVAAN